MRLNLISDVHYRLDGLARSGDGADLFVCLGDLILFLDYDEPSEGIFADLFGAENASRYIALRTERRFDEARAFGSELWQAIGAEPWTVISERVGAQYADLFAAMPAGCLTYGNVDIPALWSQYVRPDQQVLDAASTEVGGLRLGFVGGGLRTPMRTPLEISDEDFAKKVEAIGTVDIVCSHIPPSIPDLCFDVVARRMERGSDALLQYVRDVQPRFLLHGHVHQPLARRATVGRTQVINVGHFRSTGRPFTLDVD